MTGVGIVGYLHIFPLYNHICVPLSGGDAGPKLEEFVASIRAKYHSRKIDSVSFVLFLASMLVSAVE